MKKPLRNLNITLAIVLCVAIISFTMLLVRIVQRKNNHDNVVPIRPLDFGYSVNKTETSKNATVDLGDVFSQNEESVETFQTECKYTHEPCEAFSDECCPGLICVPWNDTVRCSHHQGTICLSIGMVCDDAVHGVECCDDGICTSEPGGTGPRRCLLPQAAESNIQTKTAEIPDKSTIAPTPSLRRKLKSE